MAKKQVFVLFSNNSMQYYSPDGTILQIQKQGMMYISAKGIKNWISIQDMHRSAQLTNKYWACVQKGNRYGDGLLGDGKEAKGQQRVKLGVKLDEYTWDYPEVQENKEGYRINSDCKYAYVLLKKNLYIVQVTYLVLSAQTPSITSPNTTKLLLQKYNHKYQQFPTWPTHSSSLSSTPQYFYQKITKIFSIFNVPPYWKYPLHLIWSSLIENCVIGHQFCYIEYNQGEMRERVKMGELARGNKGTTEGSGREFGALPILGKINSKSTCAVLEIGDCVAWYGDNFQFFYDGFGFWFENDNNLQYKKINKLQPDYQFHVKAVPYTLRFKNQPQRNILSELLLFLSYKSQNKKIKHIQPINSQCQPPKFDTLQTLICQQKIPDIGIFKAFSNGTVIGIYLDKTHLTINSKTMQAKLIQKTGEVVNINLRQSSNVVFQQYKSYLHWAVQFQERVFYYDQWKHKKEQDLWIQEVVKDTEVFQRNSQTYLRL